MRETKAQDTQVLHPDVALRLRRCLESRRGSATNGLLFPVSGNVPVGLERKTHKMMERDLASARKKWIDAIKEDATLSDVERAELEASDFLKYRDRPGRFADFHSNRHTFITNLGRAGVSPKTAQELARHSDIRLTIGVYSHSDLAEKADAVGRLPAPDWLNENSVASVPQGPKVSLPRNGGRERYGSAPKSQAGINGQRVAEAGDDRMKTAEPKGSAEVVVPPPIVATSRKRTGTDSSIPDRNGTTSKNYGENANPSTAWRKKRRTFRPKARLLTPT